MSKVTKTKPKANLTLTKRTLGTTVTTDYYHPPKVFINNYFARRDDKPAFVSRPISETSSSDDEPAFVYSPPNEEKFLTTKLDLADSIVYVAVEQELAIHKELLESMKQGVDSVYVYNEAIHSMYTNFLESIIQDLTKNGQRSLTVTDFKKKLLICKATVKEKINSASMNANSSKASDQQYALVIQRLIPQLKGKVI